MNKAITEELLERYLKGSCSIDENEIVENWYASYENQPELFADEQCSEALYLKEKTKAIIKEIITESTAAYLIAPVEKRAGILTIKRVQLRLIPFFWLAAVLILLIAGVYLFYFD